MSASAAPIEIARLPAARGLPLEIVERKGIGHPDTICDALAEEFSVALSRFYIERFGMIMHHNVDKVLLRGGAAHAAFGGGRVESPIEIFLCGRATLRYRGVRVPARALATEAARAWLKQHLPALDPVRHIRIHCLVRQGSDDLVALFERAHETGIWLANDSSIGVGYAPLSPIERAVLAIDRDLRVGVAKRVAAGIGPDIKIMAAGRGHDAAITLACAFVGRHVRNLDEYRAQKQRLSRRIATVATRAAQVRARDVAVNAADDETAGSIYLTVTGTSAEAGDDGSTGRGNRINGLITPGRPMTLEAAAGKNPVSHVGKLYNVAARAIAEALVAEVPEIVRAECWLASRIGCPVTEPHRTILRVGVRGGRRIAGLDAAVAPLIRRELARLRGTWRALLAHRVPLY